MAEEPTNNEVEAVTEEPANEPAEASGPEIMVGPDGSLQEIHHETNRSLPVLLIYLFGALAIAVIVVFGARAIYHHVHHNNQGVQPASNTTSSPATPAGNSGSSNSNSSSSSSSNSSNSSSTSSGSASNQYQNQSQGTSKSNLPNSGPGNIIGIFIVASLLAGGVHYAFARQSD